jgi:hypothetical protein
MTGFIGTSIASGVGLSPLYCGHSWPIVPAPDEGWGWLWSNWWNEDWQRKPKCSENTCPSATLSTTNPTWPDPGSNPGRRGGKPATNRLSYGVLALHNYNQLWQLRINECPWRAPFLTGLRASAANDEPRLSVHALNSLTNELRFFYNFQAARI